MSTVPSWVEIYKLLCVSCGGGLSMMGLNKVDIDVYIYLFYRLVNNAEDSIHASKIVDHLSPFLSYLPKTYRAKISPNTVGTAVRKLVSLGLVEEVPAKKRPRSAERPPVQAYRAVTLGIARNTVEKSLNSHKESILTSLARFEQTEEAYNLSDDKLPEA